MVADLENIGDKVKADISVMQIDICQSSQLPSEIGLHETAAVLMMFFSALAEVTTEFDGAVDKYPGDAVMSFFGLTQEKSKCTNSIKAAATAMAIVEDAVNPALAEWDIPPISCTGAVCAGECLLAHVGTERHSELVAIGNAPNTAANLQACATPHVLLVEKKTLQRAQESLEQHASRVPSNQLPCASYVMDWRAVANAL